MNIVLICGSHRFPSQSFKVTRFLAERLLDLSDHITPNILELARVDLPYWDPGFAEKTPRWQTIWAPISDTLKAADGIIVITPEWEGMVPAKLKNFFLLCSPTELGHKPGLIVTVSSGAGGSNPINELRISSAKNNRLCYIPEHLIIRQVRSVLNTIDGYENQSDEYYQKRIDFTLNLFQTYVQAFQGIRNSGKAFHPDFKFGM